MSELSVDITVQAEAFTLEAKFSAPPGITVLFGPSGAGKSTTLAAIGGLIRPEKGRIALGDDVWFDENGDKPVHNPEYRFDDAMIPLGASVMARVIEKRLKATGV